MSRTSARWKNAAAPMIRCGTARSSSATATAWPSLRTERTSTATDPGETPSRAIRRSTSAATPCAWARSLTQRQKRTSPPGSPVSSLAIRPSLGATIAAAASRIACPERKLCSRRTTLASGCSSEKSARFFVEAPRKRWMAWSSSPAAVMLPCSETNSESSSPWAKFTSWSSSTSTWW